MLDLHAHEDVILQLGDVAVADLEVAHQMLRLPDLVAVQLKI